MFSRLNLPSKSRSTQMRLDELETPFSAATPSTCIAVAQDACVLRWIGDTSQIRIIGTHTFLPLPFFFAWYLHLLSHWLHPRLRRLFLELLPLPYGVPVIFTTMSFLPQLTISIQQLFIPSSCAIRKRFTSSAPQGLIYFLQTTEPRKIPPRVRSAKTWPTCLKLFQALVVRDSSTSSTASSFLRSAPSVAATSTYFLFWHLLIDFLSSKLGLRVAERISQPLPRI